MSNTIQIKRSSTAAAIPTAGQLAVGELAVNLVDQKLFSKNASGTVFQLGGGATGVKNAIINGNFAVNQRGVSGPVTLAAGAYGHDRFKAGASGCTYTFATADNITTLTISAGSLIQVIEGNNLFTGTYTLSWTGTAQGKIGGGSYAGSGVTGAAVGGTNLNIEFNTGTLSLVQFEQGSVATPFERRPYGTEFQLCQWYYREINLANLRMIGAAGGGGWHQSWPITLPDKMRASPTWSANLTTSSTSNLSLGPTILSATSNVCVIYVVSNAAATLTDFTFSGSAKLIASAEL